jgi:23S rRNA (adenine2503-C2)-methyltransferase
MLHDSIEVLKSGEDQSVNFILKGDFPGNFEARYVRRSDDYFVAYLSSQSGCRQACRMCHLTATKQTNLVNADMDMYIAQAKAVLEYYQQQNRPAKTIHFGFMARGEPLANPHLLGNDTSTSVLRLLGQRARHLGLFPRFTISTILPKIVYGEELVDLFPEIHPDIYYSIYSMNPEFRKKWLPQAMPAEDGLGMLARWQQQTQKIPRIHWCFIEGENDKEEDVAAICKAVNDVGLRVNVNIVRYNPFSEQLGREPSEDVIYRNASVITGMLPALTKVKIVTRVGFDVKASCGMFVAPNVPTQILHSKG